jgi:hypothetical protein
VSAPEPAFWLLIGDTPTAVSLAAVQEKLAAGELTWDTRACPVGGSAWLPLRQIAGLAPTLSPTETGPTGKRPLPVAKLLPPLDDDGLAKDEQQPSLEQSPAPVGYQAVPWYRRSAVMSAFVLLGFCLFPPLLWAACLVCLTGGVFYRRVRKDGTLARWSAGNKVAAVVILLVQAAWLVNYADQSATGDGRPLRRDTVESGDPAVPQPNDATVATSPNRTQPVNGEPPSDSPIWPANQTKSSLGRPSAGVVQRALVGTFETAGDGDHLSITFAYPRYQLNPSRTYVWARGTVGTWQLHGDHQLLTPEQSAAGWFIMTMTAPDDPHTPLPAHVRFRTDATGKISSIQLRSFLGVEFPADKEVVLYRTR